VMAKWTSLSEWPPASPVNATAAPAMAPAIVLFFCRRKVEQIKRAGISSRLRCSLEVGESFHVRLTIGALYRFD
jgi:hypothetical protein